MHSRLGYNWLRVPLSVRKTLLCVHSEGSFFISHDSWYYIILTKCARQKVTLPCLVVYVRDNCTKLPSSLFVYCMTGYIPNGTSELVCQTAD